MRYRLLLLASVSLYLNGLSGSQHANKPMVDPPEGFVALFNGKTLDGWFITPMNNQDTWTVDAGSGVLARSHANGYIWTEKQYGDFVLDLEYKLTRHCNSGVFFRSDSSNPVQGGFEIQLMDDSQDFRTKNSHGALYDAVAPSSNPANKTGQWDKMRIRVQGDMIRVWINGVKVTDADLSLWTKPQENPDGTKNKFKTALSKLPKTGHIGFQDHGHNVQFRNVFLKEL